MGFASRIGGAMSSGFSHKQLMLAERLSLLASTGFVITNPFARVSITLSKHCFWTPKINLPPCLSVLASIAFGYPKAARPPVRHSLRGEYPQTPLVFNISFTSKGEQQ